MHDRPASSSRVGDACKGGARWLLLAAMVYAPLAFGSTRAGLKEILMFGLLAALALLLGDCLFNRRLPRLPWPAVVIPSAILAYGWLMVLNARQEFDPNLYRFFDREPIFGGLPGAVDRATALPNLLMITGMIGAFWVAGDASKNPKWKARIGLTLCLTGLAVVVLGLTARLTGLERTWLKTSFATYPYHGNAGAFINLVLPFIVYRAIAALKGKDAGVKAFWCLSALVTAACGFVNVSKAGAAITALLLAMMGLQQIVAHSHFHRRRSRTLLAAGFILGMVIVLGWAFGLDRAWNRWTEFAAQITPNNSRLLVYKTIWEEAIPVSGWWGFGPGTFQITFPFFCHHLGQDINGIWRYAHEDYLQTVMEWGWIGAALWGALIGGGLLRGLGKKFALSPSSAVPSSLLTMAARFSVLGVCLHACVDFPLQIPSLQLYAATALALLYSADQELPGRESREDGEETVRV